MILCRNRWTPPLIAALVASLLGCVPFENKPLSPAQTAVTLEELSLEDPGLQAFISTHLQRPFGEWPPNQWGLEELTLAAVYFRPDLDVARARWAVAKAGIMTAGGRPNPTLAIAPEYTANPGSGVSPWGGVLNIDWPVETAGKRAHRIAQARGMAEAARLRLLAQAWRVRAEVQAGLLDYALTTRRTELFEHLVGKQQEVVALLNQRLDAGSITAIELELGRLDLLRTQADLSDSSRLVAESRARLAQAVGLPLRALEGVEFIADPLLSLDQAAELNSDQLRRQALLGRTDLLAALADYGVSQSALQLEIAKQYPNIHLGTGYQFDQGENKWGLGLSAEIPLLNRNQGPIAEAEARRAQAAAEFLARQSGIIAEIDLAKARWQAANERLQRTGALLTAQGQLRSAAESRFNAGNADRLEVEAAEVAVDTVALSYQEGLAQALRALAALESALQRPLKLSEAAVLRAPDLAKQATQP